MERHRSRPNRGEEPARFTRGEDEECTRGGLLKEFQECICRFLTRLLRDECLGVPAHKHLSESNGRASLCVGSQSLGDSQVEAGRFRRCRSGPKRMFPALHKGIVPSFFQGLRKLAGPDPLRLREREIPVEVGVLEIRGHAASFAVAASAGWPGFGAKQELTEPKSESLLPHASRAVDEQARRKRPARQGS